MYGRGEWVVPVVTTAGVVALPNTGSNNLLVNLAISVAAGLVVWGVLFARYARNVR